jgi:uncharacterized protein with HEPN domain
MSVLIGSLLNIIEAAGESILTLTEGVEPEAFFNSRLTQMEVMNQLRVMAESSSHFPIEHKAKMAEIDWAVWSMLNMQLKTAGGFERDAVWFAVRSLVPATLMWFRIFRQNNPELFAIKP